MVYILSNSFPKPFKLNNPCAVLCWTYQQLPALVVMYVFNSKGDVLKNFIFLYNHKISYWILATFLSEAVEASRCYFFENQEWISKIYHLRIPKLLSNKILLTYFNLSEPIHKIQFNVRYPVKWKYNALKNMDLQGISHWTVFYELSLTDWNM